MTDLAAQLSYQHLSGPELSSVEPILLDVYAEIYTAVLTEPFSSDAAFYRRLCGYASRPGWDCVLASQEGQPVGYAFGHPLAPDAGWWRGLLTTVPSDDLQETGHRTFALNEIMVRAPWRGSNVARSIHDELLRARPEERATLLVAQTHPKVRHRYEQWGYTWLAAIRPDVPHAPVFDALVLPLHS